MWLYGSAGHLGTVEKHEGWMVSYNKLLSSTSVLPCSLLSIPPRQPPASLLFWQLFLMLTEPPTNGILFLDCGFFIPSKSCLSFPFPPLLFPFALFISCNGVKIGAERLIPLVCQNKTIRMVGSGLFIVPPLTLSVCACLWQRGRISQQGLSLCIFMSVYSN